MRHLFWGIITSASLLSGYAANVPANFTEKLIGSGLISPAGLAFSPDGRIFIGQQKGQIRVVQNDTLLGSNVLNFQAKVDYNTERGLTGIALDPNFAVNGYLYVYYTAKSPVSHNRLSRFTVVNNVADTAETVLFELSALPNRDDGAVAGINVSGTTTQAVWHMGGGLTFGNDGKIYVGVGEHEVTKSQASQNLGSLWGKVLRLNSDGSIPTDNPFYGRDTVTGLNKAIWAYGFRNPFTMATQRSTGRIFVGNVGDVTWEDVDTVAAGKNYGWPICEGSHVRANTTAVCPASNNFTAPLITYRHGTTSTVNGDCAIVGGTASNFRTQDNGRFFFADFPNVNTITASNGWIKSVNPLNGGDTAVFATGVANITGLGFNGNGDLYYIMRGINTTSSGQPASGAATGTIDTTGPNANTKGRVYKISYNLATAIQPAARQALPDGWLVNLDGRSLRAPNGAVGFQLFDLSGRKVWEARGLSGGEWLALPAGLSHGMLKYRWLRAR